MRIRVAKFCRWREKMCKQIGLPALIPAFSPGEKVKARNYTWPTGVNCGERSGGFVPNFAKRTAFCGGCSAKSSFRGKI